MNLDPAVQKLETGVEKGKEAVARAKVAAETYKLRPEHWARIDRAEAGVNKTLTMIDRIFPDRARGKGKQLQSQMTLLAIGATIFLIGSTALLWFFTRKKPEDEYEDYEDEYEYIEE